MIDPRQPRGLRILVVSDLPILPSIGGALARNLELMRAMRALGHEVHLAYLEMGKHLFDRALHEAEFGAGNVHRLRPSGALPGLRAILRDRSASLYRRSMRLVGSGRAAHKLLDEWLPPGFARDLRALQRRHAFGCVIVEYVWLSRLLALFPADVLKIIDTHDRFADRHLKMHVTGQPYGFYTISRNAELRGLRRADVVFANAPDEADAFRDGLGAAPRVFRVGHAIPIGDVPAAASQAAGAFAGSPSAGNIDTVRLLIEHVLPRIRESLPDFRLFLAGRICARAADAPGVVKLGVLPDLRALYARAPILLSPTRVGTGMAVKSLEALGLGVPVIATATGARGLPQPAGGVTVVPDGDFAGFAAAVVRLDSDPAAWAAMSADAHRTARSWNATQLASLRLALTRE